MPVAEASQWVDATIPNVPSSSGRVGWGLGATKAKVGSETRFRDYLKVGPSSSSRGRSSLAA
jgi:hypothetical protein